MANVNANAGTVRVEGFESLRAKLDALPKQLANKLERSSLRAGGKILLNNVKAATPADSGRGRASWKLRAAKRSRRFPGRIAVRVVTNASDSFFKGKQFYLAFLEFGTNERFHKSGKSVGAIAPPIGFVKRAATQSKDAVGTAIKADLQGRIAALAKSTA